MLIETIRAASKLRGRPLVLRPHVGEGYDPDHTGEHRRTAEDNLQKILNALVRAGYSGPDDGLIVRFGHATHATPAQIALMAEMGIIVEANVGSNLATGSVLDAREHPLLYNLYFGLRTTLSADGQGVMSTNLSIEFQRAAQLIELFRSGQMDITIDGRIVRYRDLPEDVQRRFSLDTLREWSSEYAATVATGDRVDSARSPRSE